MKGLKKIDWDRRGTDWNRKKKLKKIDAELYK